MLDTENPIKVPKDSKAFEKIWVRNFRTALFGVKKIFLENTPETISDKDLAKAKELGIFLNAQVTESQNLGLVRIEKKEVEADSLRQINNLRHFLLARESRDHQDLSGEETRLSTYNQGLEESKLDIQSNEGSLIRDIIKYSSIPKAINAPFCNDLATECLLYNKAQKDGSSIDDVYNVVALSRNDHLRKILLDKVVKIYIAQAAEIAFQRKRKIEDIPTIKHQVENCLEDLIELWQDEYEPLADYYKYIKDNMNLIFENIYNYYSSTERIYP
ncbi:MAG: hypothetical protein ABID45_02880 [Patescibacteria group bacterium]